MSAGLAGTGLVANGLYLMAHHEATILPSGELACQVHRVLAGERQPFLVRDWLLFLARTAAGDHPHNADERILINNWRRKQTAVSWRPMISARSIKIYKINQDC